MLNRWIEVARAVGRALLDVLAAEAAELQRDLARSGRELRGGLVLFALAAGIAFWTLGVGLWAAIQLLATWLSVRSATLLVFGLGTVSTLVLIWWGRRRLRRIETPVKAFKRRGREHLDWWRQSVVPGLGGERREGDSGRLQDERTGESDH